MISLIQLKSAELDAYFEQLWKVYHEETIQAGGTEEQAKANISDTKSEVFTDGVLNKEQHIFNVMDEDKHVGFLWLVQRSHISLNDWYIYDIEIFESERKKGYGTSAMIAAEEYVRKAGGKVLGLSVFGFNTAARTLYESLGYETTRILMKKDL
jgi:ribosomal protein S18 acetylase RimI-like enzyme